MKTKNEFMDINRETAMRLWVQTYGKECKVTDFAGRVMVKAAYDDRNSQFGWNIDHILPQSRGGKSSESNLICCHILTNDEKADSFPCFNANGKSFEIVKVQNQYEIKPKGAQNKSDDDSSSEKINLFDSAAGTRFYKNFKGKQNGKHFLDVVTIDLFGLKDYAVVDFLSYIYEGKHIFYKKDNWDSHVTMIIKEYDKKTKEDAQNMLDLCVLANKYLNYYFKKNRIVNDYQIYFGELDGEDKLEIFSYDLRFNAGYEYSIYPFVINQSVLNNTRAKEQLQDPYVVGYDSSNQRVYSYDFSYIQLRENLNKN